MAKCLTLKRGESNIPNLFVKLEVDRLDEPPANHRGALARPSVTTAAYPSGASTPNIVNQFFRESQRGGA